MNADILMQDVQSLLEKFARNLYKAKDTDPYFVNIIIEHYLSHKCGIKSRECIQTRLF